MDYLTFQAVQYRKEFTAIVKELSLSLTSNPSDTSTNTLKLLSTMHSNIDVMQRLEGDRTTTGTSPLSADDITQIGDYALALLEEISNEAAMRGLQNSMMSLQRLSLPIAIWISNNHGTINKLDIVVNAIATFANEIKQQQQLAKLCLCIQKVIASVSHEIRRDLEATNAMRPWRILNLNWGIVATRSHDAELMEQVFPQIIKNIPVDAKSFFLEGMQQMQAIDYPEHVRKVMEKYSQSWGIEQNIH